MELKAYGIYYPVTKLNYYLQGSDIVVCNDHMPLQKFLNFFRRLIFCYHAHVKLHLILGMLGGTFFHQLDGFPLCKPPIFHMDMDVIHPGLKN